MEQDLSVNRQVSRLMAAYGMSSARLAAMTEIPYKSLCRALRGERPFYTEELPPLAKALRVNTDTLLQFNRF